MNTRRHRRILPTEATQQLIAFRLRQQWFALPILAVQKVIPLEKVWSNGQPMSFNVAHYQGQAITIVDIASRIFKQAASSEPEQRYLAIVQCGSGLLGLPMDSPPSLRRVPLSAFSPLPDSFPGGEWISSVVTEAAEQSPLFLLNEQLLAS